MALAYTCDSCGKSASVFGNWRRVTVEARKVDLISGVFYGMPMPVKEVPGHSGHYCSASCAVAGVTAAIVAAWPATQAGPVVEDSSG